jgi:hypothetical protein
LVVGVAAIALAFKGVVDTAKLFGEVFETEKGFANPRIEV